MSDRKQYNPQDFDKTKFNVSAYSRRIDKPWGYEIHLVSEDTSYMMKILHINQGARLSEQVHDEKRESWTLMNGEAKVVWEDSGGNTVETVLENGVGFSTHVGQRHRLVGITEADILECSTPESGTTYRLQDDYARPDETPEQRKIERGEI